MNKDIKMLAKKVLDLGEDEELFVKAKDQETYVITYKVIYDSSMYVFSHLGAASTIVLLDEHNLSEIECWLVECTGGEYEESTNPDLVKDGWTCTDVSCGQWCKKVDDFSYLYFERGNGDKDTPTMIDVRDYTVKEVESAINSYGYTLSKKDNFDNIYELYGDSAIQIIAESLFELEENY